MATELKVEVFQCEETAAEPIEATEEAIRLIRELGLTGQEALIAGKTAEDDDGNPVIPRRCPYRAMTTQEEFVWRVLCPRQFELAQYRRTPIPLRVLQVLSHAKSLRVFEESEFQVWDAESEADKDPVLVGCVKTGQWQRQWYALARWGEELESWPTLLKRAVQNRKAYLTASANKCAAEMESFLRRLKTATDEEIVSSGHGRDVSFYHPHFS